MKTNASSTASAWRIKRCICPCEVGTKITYGGSNLQLSMYKLHIRDKQLFFDFMATKFKLVLLSKIISKIRYSKVCILYHITYTTIDRQMAENGFAPPPLGNFADISYIVEN